MKYNDGLIADFFQEYLGDYTIVELLAYIEISIFIYQRDSYYMTDKLTTTDFFFNTFNNQQPPILYCYF